MRIAGKTDIGRSRAENQDTFRSGSLPGLGAFGVVCDGMGGAQHGRLASTMAADSIEAQLFQGLKTVTSGTEMENLILDAIRLANGEIFSRSGEGELIMGTTVVLAVVHNDVLHIAHVGDSRAYIYEGGRLIQVTRDHSMVQELVDQGALTPAEASHHPEKNVITRALGVEATVDISYSRRPFLPNSTLLLCSDGLTNMVSPERIAHVLQNFDFYDQPSELVSDALLAGGHDNITVVVMQKREVVKNG